MTADSSKPNKPRNVYPIRSTTRKVNIHKLKLNLLLGGFVIQNGIEKAHIRSQVLELKLTKK